VGGRRERARREYRFMKLMKYEKRGENYALFYFPGKSFFFIFMKSLLHRKKKNAPLFTTCVWGGGVGREVCLTIKK
jgi:hypothetical protein